MAKLARWGNSNGGLRLPQTVLDAAGLRVGDDLACRLLDSGAILLTPKKGVIAVPAGQIQRVAPAKAPSQAETLAKW